MLIVELEVPEADTRPDLAGALDYYRQAQSRYGAGDYRGTAESIRQALAVLVGEAPEAEPRGLPGTHLAPACQCQAQPDHGGHRLQQGTLLDDQDGYMDASCLHMAGIGHACRSGRRLPTRRDRPGASAIIIRTPRHRNGRFLHNGAPAQVGTDTRIVMARDGMGGARSLGRRGRFDKRSGDSSRSCPLRQRYAGELACQRRDESP